MGIFVLTTSHSPYLNLYMFLTECMEWDCVQLKAVDGSKILKVVVLVGKESTILVSTELCHIHCMFMTLYKCVILGGYLCGFERGLSVFFNKSTWGHFSTLKSYWRPSNIHHQQQHILLGRAGVCMCVCKARGAQYEAQLEEQKLQWAG